MRYKGDTGKVRKALATAGFLGSQTYADDAFIFNDKAKNGTRRLKVWSANSIIFADDATQQRVADALKSEFGDRLIQMFSIPWMHTSYLPRLGDRRALCIRLKA